MSETNQTDSITGDSTAEQLRDNIRKLLGMACGDPTPCRHCGRPVWWLTMLKSGKKNPFTDDGVSHFADCSGAAGFRKGKS